MRKKKIFEKKIWMWKKKIFEKKNFEMRKNQKKSDFYKQRSMFE
jgi:hypothetical protein